MPRKYSDQEITELKGQLKTVGSFLNNVSPKVWIAAAIVMLGFVGCVSSMPKEPTPLASPSTPPAQGINKPVKSIADAVNSQPKVAPTEKELSAKFFFAFRDKLDPYKGEAIFQEGKRILIANENDYGLFAKNSCELKKEFNGDAKAAAQNWVDINQELVLTASQKAQVYQWQFDALTQVGLCQ